MKTIRSLMTLAGFSLVLCALGAIGTRAQSAPSLSTTNFAGSMTLPADAQWGRLTLPAGDYDLYYGTLNDREPFVVEVVGKAEGAPHGLVIPLENDTTSASKSSLICVRAGGALIVRTLEMARIGKSASFAMPRGAQLVARNGKHNGYTQLAEAPMLIQRIPVSVNAK